MAPQVTKRQPLSCENCRKRKIRCTGEKPVCDTCSRRGFSHTCVYLRQSGQVSPFASSDEVLQTVKRMETLLERQVNMLEQHFDIPSTSSSHQDVPSHRQPSSLDSSPWSEMEDLDLDKQGATIVGWILTSEEGYQRFIPSHPSSDAGAVNELIQSASNPAFSSSFPFSTELLGSKQSLLDALPPACQCEALKDIYFEVFSPVCVILPLYRPPSRKQCDVATSTHDMGDDFPHCTDKYVLWSFSK